jgi:phosphoserine phosphatase
MIHARAAVVVNPKPESRQAADERESEASWV